jgi:hypothetical protein
VKCYERVDLDEAVAALVRQGELAGEEKARGA